MITFMFSCSKKPGSKNEIFVLPKPKKLRIILPEFGAYTANSITESSSDKSGEDHSEIRLVREYRDGDLTRHIHRNYSAKTEKLWVKEYNKENDHIFDFTADTSGSELTAELLDAMTSDLSCTREEFSRAAAGLSSEGMVINTGLEWFFLGQHVFTFNRGNVVNELLGNIFDLRR